MSVHQCENKLVDIAAIAEFDAIEVPALLPLGL
jgi:hypothetical protein